MYQLHAGRESAMSRHIWFVNIVVDVVAAAATLFIDVAYENVYM